MTTLLVDADLLLHRCAAAVQKTYVWSASVKSVAADLNQAKDKFQQDLLAIRSKLDSGRIIMALSCPAGTNWRKQVLPSYKHTRTKVAKPILFRELRSWIEDQWVCKSIMGLEGDDVLGIMATNPKTDETGSPADRIIVSGDKDMRTIPARLFDTFHPERGVATITPEEADYRHLFQTLTGDTSDGYTGIPGVGPKKAEKILNAAPRPHTTHSALCACSAWDKVVRAYQDAGLTEQDALIQARVAHILRWGEFQKNMDTEGNGGVRLWTPEGMAA